VFFADALRSAPFFAVALIAFATCTAAFLLVALCERERTLRVVFTDWRAFLLMNLFTAAAWLQYFQSLRFLEPAIANVLHAGLGPLTIMAMGAIGWRIVEAGRMTAIETACQAAMALCLVGLVAVALAGLSAGEGSAVALTGCAFAVGSGVAITLATPMPSACTIRARAPRQWWRRASSACLPRPWSRCRSCRMPAPRRSRLPPGLRSRPPHSSSWRCRSISTRSA